MSIRKLSAAAVILLATAAPLAPARADEHDGIVKIKSAYPIAETIARIKKGMAGKGIRFFLEIDQSQLSHQPEIILGNGSCRTVVPAVYGAI